MHAEIAAGLAERKQLLEEFTAAETKVSDLSRAQRKAEADLTPVRERKERDQQRLDNGSVGDPKQLSQISEEIASLTRRISDLEDAQLEVMESLEAANTEFEALKSRRTDLEQQLREKMAGRDEEVKKIDREIDSHAMLRQAYVIELPDALLKTYERLRTQHGGVGAAELKQRRCLGCQLELNAADLREYAAAAPDDVLRCEECDRILIRTADSGL